MSAAAYAPIIEVIRIGASDVPPGTDEAASTPDVRALLQSLVTLWMAWNHAAPAETRSHNSHEESR